MKITLTEMEKHGNETAYVIRTHLYSDMILDAANAFIAYRAYDSRETDYRCVTRLPDGEVAFVFTFINEGCFLAEFDEGKTYNFKTWRHLEAPCLLSCIRDACNAAHVSQDANFRKMDVDVSVTVPVGYTNVMKTFHFNVAAAMYLYDTLMDHTSRTFKQYDAGFAAKVVGNPYDPITSEAIAEVKRQISQMCKAVTYECNEVKDKYRQLKEDVLTECTTKCNAELKKYLNGREYDMLDPEVRRIKLDCYRKVRVFEIECDEKANAEIKHLIAKHEEKITKLVEQFNKTAYQK